MKLTIEEKLVGSSLLGLFIVGGLITFWTSRGAQELTQRIDSVYTDVVIPLIDIQQMRKSIHTMESELLNAVSTGTSPSTTDTFKIIHENGDSLSASLNQYEQRDTIVSETYMKALLKKVGALGELNYREQEELKLSHGYLNQINLGVATIEDLLSKHRQSDAQKYYNAHLKDLFDEAEKVPDVLMELQLEQAKYANMESVRAASNLSNKIITTILVSFAAVGLLVFSLSRKLIIPLRRITTNLIGITYNLSCLSQELMDAAVEQASHTLLAIKKSETADTPHPNKPETLDALYAVDDSNKKFENATLRVKSMCDEISSISGRLNEVVGTVQD